MVAACAEAGPGRGALGLFLVYEFVYVPVKLASEKFECFNDVAGVSAVGCPGVSDDFDESFGGGVLVEENGLQAAHFASPAPQDPLRMAVVISPSSSS